MTVALLATLGLAAPAGAQTPAPPPAGAPAAKPELPALDIVVLVDESGSLSPADVDEEKKAARSIAQSVLSPQSTVSVIGFGSSDAPGQDALDEVCPTTKLDSAQATETVVACVGTLRRRGDQEGNGTDHNRALQKALSILDDRTDRPKIVFMLTDGVLDVRDTAAYGRDLGDPARTRDERNAEALQQVQEALTKLKDLGAQVWPLGYGSADAAQLGRFVTGASCDPNRPAPAARVIGGSADLTTAILDAYQSAACVGVSSPEPRSLAPGETTTLTVTVPPIASDGAILVYKRDPRIRVSYKDPLGRNPLTDPGESTVSITGQAAEVESLHVVDPEPGTWTITAEAPADVPEGPLAATVVYQGAVSASLSLNPPQPAAGEDVTVEMSLRARRARVADAALLADLTFTADLTTGGSTTPQTPLSDPDGDGVFAGTLTVPANAAGEVDITGRVSGPGVGGDTRTYSTRIRTTPADLQAQIVLTDPGPAVAGGTATGRVAVTNLATRDRSLALVLDDVSPDSRMTLDPVTVAVPAGGKAEVPFVLRLGTDTAIGSNQAHLVLVDQADRGRYAERELRIQVDPAPGVVEKVISDYWWLLLLLVVALVAGVAALLLAGRRRRRENAVGGLALELFVADRKVGDTLRPERSDADVFRFRVQGLDGPRPVLRATLAGDAAAYTLRRSGGRLLLERGSGAGPEPVASGQRVPLSGDTELSVLDERSGRVAPSRAGTPFSSGGVGRPQAPTVPVPRPGGPLGGTGTVPGGSAPGRPRGPFDR